MDAAIPATTEGAPAADALISGAAARAARLGRRTAETAITVDLDLDGSGRTRVSTGVGFFDHMLTAFGRHALLDLEITAEGDLEVDSHHTTEDVGIVLGQAVAAALGDKRGVRRYGHAVVPMDEALVAASVDLSGRGLLAFDVRFANARLGQMDTELFEEFFRAFATNAALTLHLRQQAGANTHHVAEACFKSLARALREAVELDPRAAGHIPSTKGSL